MAMFGEHTTRRNFLVAGAGAISAIGIAPPAIARSSGCLLTPEQEEGPFYLPASLVRSDLAAGESGLPLAIEFRVVDAATCAPMPHATVDIWHCNAMGVYSGFAEMGGPPNRDGGPPNRDGGPPPNGAPPKMQPVTTARFLRGVTPAGSDGIARFDTVFPGFYAGRVNHVHLKVRVPGAMGVVHTGQLFFPEAIASDVSSQSPYASHTIHRTTLAEDGVFRRQHGSDAIADVRRVDHGRSPAYLARLTVVVDRKAVPEPVGGPTS